MFQNRTAILCLVIQAYLMALIKPAPTTDWSNFACFLPPPSPEPGQQMRCQQFVRQQFIDQNSPDPIVFSTANLPLG